VKEHRTHDWDKKEQAQARLRLFIKKVLRKHGYPPNKETKQSKTFSNRQNCRLRECKHKKIDFLFLARKR